MSSTLALECLALVLVSGVRVDAVAGGVRQRKVHIIGASGNYHVAGKQRSVVSEKHPGGSQWRKAGALGCGSPLRVGLLRSVAGGARAI